MGQLSRTIARNSLSGVAAQMIIKVLSFAFSTLVVRQLGVDAYGQYSAVLAFGAMFVFLADLGLSPYAVRELARWRDAPEGTARANRLYGNLLLLRLLLSIVSAVLLTFMAWLTGRPPMMVLAIALGALGLVVYSVQGASDVVLSGFERLDLSAGAKVLSQLAFVLAGAAVLWLGAGYLGLVSANLLSAALFALLCWTGARRLGLAPSRPTPRVWLPMLRAGIPFGLIGFTLGLSYKFDSVLLNIFRTDAETGYYNAAYNLVFSVVILSNVFNTSLYPSLARQAANSTLGLDAIYERAMRYLMLAALPIAAGVFVVADRLVPFLYTASYAPAIPALQILMWTAPLMFASEFLGYIAVIQGNEHRVARAVLVSTGLNMCVNLALVPLFGFMGAAVMTVVTEAVLVAQYAWMLRRRLRKFDWSMVLLRPLFAAAVMAGVLEVFHELPILVAIAAGGAIYFGLLLALGVISRDELHFIRQLRRPPHAIAADASPATP